MTGRQGARFMGAPSVDAALGKCGFEGPLQGALRKGYSDRLKSRKQKWQPPKLGDCRIKLPRSGSVQQYASTVGKSAQQLQAMVRRTDPSVNHFCEVFIGNNQLIYD